MDVNITTVADTVPPCLLHVVFMVPHPESERKGKEEGGSGDAIALHFIYVGGNSFAFYERADVV
jgi:hypothetical protein